MPSWRDRGFLVASKPKYQVTATHCHIGQDSYTEDDIMFFEGYVVVVPRGHRPSLVLGWWPWGSGVGRLGVVRVCPGHA